MCKFIITITLEPGMRDRILDRAVEAQRAMRAESGCIAYDFFTCTDDPDKLLSWKLGPTRPRTTSIWRKNTRRLSSPSMSSSIAR